METQKQLIEAAQQGSVKAFEQLISQLQGNMLSVAAGLSQFADDAEDIFQEAIINAYAALPRFRAESQFSTWLYRITVNTALAYKRNTSNSLSRFSEPEQGASESQHVAPGPLHYVENERLNAAISKAIDTLSEQERVAFVLCHQQELSIAHAAEIMDCSKGAIKSYMFRSRNKLRKQLQDYRQ